MHGVGCGSGGICRSLLCFLTVALAVLLMPISIPLITFPLGHKITSKDLHVPQMQIVSEDVSKRSAYGSYKSGAVLKILKQASNTLVIKSSETIIISSDVYYDEFFSKRKSNDRRHHSLSRQIYCRGAENLQHKHRGYGLKHNWWYSWYTHTGFQVSLFRVFHKTYLVPFSQNLKFKTVVSVQMRQRARSG